MNKARRRSDKSVPSSIEGLLPQFLLLLLIVQLGTLEYVAFHAFRVCLHNAVKS